MSPTEMQRTLAAWREAEKRLDATVPGPVEHAEALAEVGRLRHRYQSILEGPGAMAADPPDRVEDSGAG
jgi:hypothetical protein